MIETRKTILLVEDDIRLAIAKRIVLWHRGEIEAEVSLRQGARFTIYLPVFP